MDHSAAPIQVDGGDGIPRRVVFADERAIRQNSFSEVASAIIRVWDSCSDWDWTGRIGFLDAEE